MRRGLLAFASGSSLVLCVATFAVCVVTIVHPLSWSGTWYYYSARPGLGGPEFQRHRCVAVRNGVLHVQLVQLGRADPRWPATVINPGYPLSYPFLENFLGFSLYLDAGWPTGGGSYREFSMPVWVVVASLAIPPALTHRQRRTRSLVGWVRCGSCDYNLTGNVSGV